jgi:Zn-dependent peptidase ImmA (M78 family)
VVGQYEQGRTKPSPGTLAALALHLGFPPEFFERRVDGVSRVIESQTHFRRLRSTSKLQRERLLVRLELLSEVLQQVETHVRLPAVAIPAADVEEGDDDAVEAAAAAVRAAWGLSGGPIENVVRLLESKGVLVVRPLIGTGDVDAFSTWAAGRPVVILSSDKDDAARSRFDAAHELGHLVMHHDAAPGHQAVERQAQRFAAAFLMPADVIRRELPSRMSWPAYFDLKVRWRVSLQALLYRARTLCVLSADGYQRAQIHLSRNWGREVEPIELGPPEQPVLLTKALELMESKLQMTKERLAADAHFPLRFVDDLLSDVIPRPENRPQVPIET